MTKEEIYGKIKVILQNNFSEKPKQKIKVYPDKFNFACPYCGDSAKNVYAKRGNFYLANLQYICYNEGCKANIFKFFNDFGQSLDLEQKLDIINNYSFKPNRNSVDLDVVLEYFDKLIKIEDFLDQSRNTDFKVEPLQKNSKVDRYLDNRKIKNKDNIYQGVFGDQNILVILNTINDKLISLQFRNLSEKNRIYKYYNFSQIYKTLFGRELEGDEVKVYNKISPLFKLFQIDFNKPITIIEGYLDSTFFKNSISLVGIHTDIDLFLNDDLDIKWVFDNDPINPDEPQVKPIGIKKAEKMLKKGESVFLWKKFIDENFLDKNTRDINKAVLQNENVVGVLDKYFSNDAFDLIYL